MRSVLTSQKQSIRQTEIRIVKDLIFFKTIEYFIICIVIYSNVFENEGFINNLILNLIFYD